MDLANNKQQTQVKKIIGDCPCYLYLDARGFLTIGYGHVLSYLDWELEWEKDAYQSSRTLVYEYSQKNMQQINQFEFTPVQKEKILNAKVLKADLEYLCSLPFLERREGGMERGFFSANEKRVLLRNVFENFLEQSIRIKAKKNKGNSETSFEKVEKKNVTLPMNFCLELSHNHLSQHKLQNIAGAQKNQFAGRVLQIHQGKQGKHIPGHNNYTKGRSVVIHPLEKLQDLVNLFASTGQVINNEKEMVNFGECIGYHIEPGTEKVTMTSWAVINYASQDVHIVPAYPPCICYNSNNL